MKRAALGLSACLALSLLSPGFAQDLKVSGTMVSIEFPGHVLVTLEVVGPRGLHQQVQSKSSTAAINLGAPADGLYKYEASGTSRQMTANHNPLKLDNGRGSEPAMIYVGSSASGTFSVKGGAVILPNVSDDNDSDG